MTDKEQESIKLNIQIVMEFEAWNAKDLEMAKKMGTKEYAKMIAMRIKKNMEPWNAFDPKMGKQRVVKVIASGTESE